MPRRHRPFTAKRLVAVLSAASGAVLLGSLIATHTVSSINPFYRYAVPPGWREPVVAPPAPTQPAPIAYSPIGWGPDVAAVPPAAELPPAPELDAYDDRALLAEIENPPPLPYETEIERLPMPAVVRADAPSPVVTQVDAPAPAAVIQVVSEPTVPATADAVEVTPVPQP